MRLILFVAMLLPAVALCQLKKSYPVFGKADKADLQQTSCNFDKDAEAMVIFESAKLFFDFTNNGLYKELQHTVRIKILNDNGLKWANVKLRYESRLRLCFVHYGSFLLERKKSVCQYWQTGIETKQDSGIKI